MANSGKVSKGLTYKTKSKLIFGIAVALLLLIVGGYFVYITGIVTKIVPAVRIDQTVGDQTKTIGKAYVPELNYYRNQILSMYSMYGLGVDEGYLDTVDEATGKTNSQLIYDQAAEQLMNVRLVNEQAKKDAGFVCGADRYAAHQVELLEDRSSSKFSSVNQYLAAVYGTGMSVSTFKQIVADQSMTQEYEQYLRQFTFAPTQEELDKAYDENTNGFTTVNFNGYLFDSETFGDDAEKYAEAVAAAAKDSETFNTAIIEQIGEDVAESIGFTVEANTSYFSSVSRTSIEGEAFPEGLEEFAFDTANVGKAKVIEFKDKGWYVALLDKVDDKTDPTFSYREIVLVNEYASEEDAKESKIVSECDKLEKQAEEIKAGITDELSFVSAVKKYTENYDAIATGGYTSGVSSDVYQTEYTAENVVSFGAWIADPARQHGDMLIVRESDNSKVTLYYFDESVPEWADTVSGDIISAKVNDWSQTALNVSSTVPYVAYDLAEKLTYYAR